MEGHLGLCWALLGQFYLVVNIRHVHDILDIEAKVMHHDATNDIASHIVSSMSQMAFVVNCRTAHIPGDLARLHGHKGHRRPWLKGIVHF